MINLQETLIDIAKALVDTPEEVKVTQTEDERTITLSLTVAPDDMGMVIGRHGKIAKAIRSVIKAASAGTGKKVNVEIVDAE
ncbi:MAG: KH domain-containing protein [Clostridia bacterium]|nr:KH domain-containing protein [Clostridia bacterium]